MKLPRFDCCCRLVALVSGAAVALLLLSGPTPAQQPAGSQPLDVPEVLKPWQEWVLWGVEHRNCPRIYSDGQQAICFWPSRMELTADDQSGRFEVQVRVFEESWVPLPGNRQWWPINVRVADQPQVVVDRQGQPCVQLAAGEHQLSGEFRWAQMPQKIPVPKQIGVLSLQVGGNAIALPNWDADGHVWFKRSSSEPADADLMQLQVYRLIEDGIPIWLRTEIELTVSGKSREEELGWVLPEGWQLSTVDSPLPVAVDDRGFAKVQVRAGKWTIALHAFRTTDAAQIGYADGVQPVAPQELVGLRVDPEFRTSQLEGLATVDASQTTYPPKWRRFPVHTWETGTSFQLVEKMRGVGQLSGDRLQLDRRLWLDDDGKALTYQDQLRGKLQQLWRLDVAEGHDLGAVRVDGERQLITVNPDTGAGGVEIRNRDLELSALGRLPVEDQWLAVGWQTDVDELDVRLTLPPGWRALAIFGADADTIDGDWLTAWSLLDLFLLLIFSIAVYRLFGITAGVVALVAFGLAYHEPGAPRFTWLLLLMPLALLRVVTSGAGQRWLVAWKYASLALLLVALIPFIALQTQSVIYPQLDTRGMAYGSRGIFEIPGAAFFSQMRIASGSSSIGGAIEAPSGRDQAQTSRFDASNLLYEPQAKIQTGPARPRWTWNDVHLRWNGTVTADQSFRPVLISLTQHRLLTMLRVVLLMILAAILLGVRTIRWPRFKAKPAAAAMLGIVLLPGVAAAQIPEPELLNDLRGRLLETPDVFPKAAEMPQLDLTIEGDQLRMNATVHAAAEVAVPFPGRLPTWSPLTVSLDGKPDVLVVRRDDFLWALVPEGVHEIEVEARLPDRTEWEWTFLLQPHYVTVAAPGWKVTGLDPNGVPDQQLFFAKEVQASDDASYDRNHFNAVAVVDRYLEVGLEWKVRSTVTRLSDPGKALSLQVPLISGESVLSGNRDVSDGAIAIRLGENQSSTEWISKLTIADEITLQAPPSDQWVERWHLITSPIWNVEYRGETSPIYESEQKDLLPVWQPWPGEGISLMFDRLAPVVGETITVQQVNHTNTIRSRVTNQSLVFDLECSLANDFVVDLDPDAEIKSLKVDQQVIPIQFREGQLTVPARPGRQSVEIEWDLAQSLGWQANGGAIELPVAASNVSTGLAMPENRWILWADGPLRGPAVRFWTILAIAVLTAIALGSVPASPLRRWEWVLLAIGLTQVHLVLAILVIGWLFVLAWRGNRTPSDGRIPFNALQTLIVLWTFAALLILVNVVGQGLLGHPDMFIVGNGSTRLLLQWFDPRSGLELPRPYVYSVSVWFYRLLMLFWALWLAMSLLRWLTWGWKQFSHGGAWQREPVVAELVDE